VWAPRRLPAQFRGGCARAKTACRKDAVISQRRSAKTAAGIAARAVRGCREAQRECAAAGLARAAGGRRVSRASRALNIDVDASLEERCDGGRVAVARSFEELAVPLQLRAGELVAQLPRRGRDAHFNDGTAFTHRVHSLVMKRKYSHNHM